MTGPEYRQHLADLGITQSAAAHIVGVSARTSRSWAQKGPPPSVAILLTLIRMGKVTLADLDHAATILKLKSEP